MYRQGFLREIAKQLNRVDHLKQPLHLLEEYQRFRLTQKELQEIGNLLQNIHQKRHFDKLAMNAPIGQNTELLEIT